MTHAVSFVGGGAGRPVALHQLSGRSDLRFTFVFTYDVVHRPDAQTAERYRVLPTSYVFKIMDREESKIIAYHWHPAGISPVRRPHLHLHGIPPRSLPPIGGVPSMIELGDLHLPTRHITLEDVVELLIAELGVQPRRADWAAVLAVGRTSGRDWSIGES